MKTVLAVIPSLAMGGAEKAFAVWVQALQEIGYKVIVATSEEEEDFFTLSPSTLRYSRRSPRRGSSSRLRKIRRLLERLLDPYLNALYLRGLIRQIKPHLVIAHLPKSAIPAILASKRENIPCVVMEHLYQKRLKDPILNYLRPILYPCAQALVVLTPSMRELFSALNKKIYQISNPLLLPCCERIVPFERKEEIILLVGRLNKQKQFAHFVECLANFDLKGWKVWIAGEGQERKTLLNLIKTYSLEKNVYLLGAIKDVESLYQRASIFVLCSKREGAPLVLAESALYGCVRVSFKCPSGPESLIEDQRTGYLIENQNWSALLDKINELMTKKDERKKIYEQTLASSQDFSPRKIALAWDNLIKEVLY